MASPEVAMPPASSKTKSYVGNKRKEDIRMTNINVARSVSSVVHTSLGHRGMDKMISTASGEVIITNDGATILDKMEVLQPPAKMLVELSKSQDIVAGDVLVGSLIHMLDGYQRLIGNMRVDLWFQVEAPVNNVIDAIPMATTYVFYFCPDENDLWSSMSVLYQLLFWSYCFVSPM
ncbi:hypothetical protein L6452_36455 [Arctium lappa]|uniref:Uncharacterized protein n=1 Tax=Arctium lappa TaxID=4217 RepID=A0ACB8YDG1_ARCLA|nr:hypothetical protein L6452_36455 [Arctium lappa]